MGTEKMYIVQILSAERCRKVSGEERKDLLEEVSTNLEY